MLLCTLDIILLNVNNENEYGESQEKLGLTKFKCDELGRAMVLPEYRNKGLMKELGVKLVECARENNIEYLIATAHPDNYASKKSFINNNGFNELFLYCWNKYIGVKYKNYKSIKDIEYYQAVLFGYFTFFESVYLMYKKCVVKMSLLDDLFGRRFFVVVNCKEVQELDLKTNRVYYENIFKLYKVWRQYRLAHNKTELTTRFKNNKEFTELDK